MERMKLLLLCLIFAFMTAGAQRASAQPTPHSVALTWAWTQGTGGPATGFLVQRATVSGGPYTTVGTITSPATLAFTDTASNSNVLTEGSTYFYVVVATGNGGVNSPPSNQFAALIPFLAPQAPTGLTGTVK